MSINLDVLKFRVWDKENECYQQDDADETFIRPNGTLMCVFWGDCDKMPTEYVDQAKAVIERSTGLKDMDGNLIFENDKILFVENLPGGFDLTHKIVVTWNNERGFWDPFNQIDPRFVKIIGNVHRESEASK